ncbi:hypothetical protein K8R42_05480, partial [bacterium]|nr:hypothetical protein [bacterium]
MKNPDMPPTGSEQEGQDMEQLEAEYAERLIEAALIHGFEFDEGQNAIIMEVSPDDLLPEIRDYFFQGQDAQMPDEEFVSKVLRVYGVGEGAKEAGMQKQAKQILETQDNQEELAQVPELYIDREVTIRDPKLKTQLKQSGIDMSQDKVAVMLMYRVKGVDLMNYLMQELVKNISEEEALSRPSVDAVRKQLANSPNDVDVSQLFRAAAMTCGFEGNDGIVLNANDRDRLIKYLQKNDFILDPSIISKIENALKILNNNGLYHNDLTERNVMVEFDDNGDVVEVYIIDFEKSSDEENPDFGGDMAIMTNYKELTESSDQRTEEVIDTEILAAQKFTDHISKARPEF